MFPKKYDNYTKNLLLELEEKELLKQGYQVEYDVGVSFEEKTLSLIFKKALMVYIRRLAMLLGKSLNPNLQLTKYRDWQQKRKNVRLTPHSLLPIQASVEENNVEVEDISMGGIKIRTPFKMSYGLRCPITLGFNNQEHNVFGIIKFIKPKVAKKQEKEK